MHRCSLCPRECGADRYTTVGSCRAGLRPKVASCNVHHGEEPPISGTRGSGTIFFSNCNMSCVYCQNFPISQLGAGNEMSVAYLAKEMLCLQKRGVHNINFVTPSHMVAQLIAAVYLARKGGLTIPIVYNTSGYDSVTALEILDGIVDIYLADIRYADDAKALLYSGVEHYVETDLAALRHMYASVGNLVCDDEGVAVRGLIIRLLVFPMFSGDTSLILRKIHDSVSPDARISLMNQYFPAHRAHEFPAIDRRLAPGEYASVVDEMEHLGFEGWKQDIENDEGDI